MESEQERCDGSGEIKRGRYQSIGGLLRPRRYRCPGCRNCSPESSGEQGERVKAGSFTIPTCPTHRCWLTCPPGNPDSAFCAECRYERAEAALGQIAVCYPDTPAQTLIEIAGAALHHKEFPATDLAQARERVRELEAALDELDEKATERENLGATIRSNIAYANQALGLREAVTDLRAALSHSTEEQNECPTCGSRNPADHDYVPTNDPPMGCPDPFHSYTEEQNR